MSLAQPHGPRIIVALDYADPAQALALAEKLDPQQCRLKVGKELFTRGGPGLVQQLSGRGFDIFLDLKFHDIPNTVAQAVKAAAELGIWMVNVHAFGGSRMLEAAREALAPLPQRPLLIAVTVLTSMSEAELHELGISGGLDEQVARLAGLAQHAGLDGVVCSAREARSLRMRFGPHFRLVTPGIRPRGAEQHDQQRSMTPAEALQSGVDYLVIGRPITQAADPVAALAAIRAEIAAPLC